MEARCRLKLAVLLVAGVKLSNVGFLESINSRHGAFLDDMLMDQEDYSGGLLNNAHDHELIKAFNQSSDTVGVIFQDYAEKLLYLDT